MYIDLTYLKDITANDATLIKRLVDTYMEGTPKAIAKLKKAYESQQWEEVSAIAHEIQSSAGIVGNEELRLELKSLENMASTSPTKKSLSPLINRITEIHNISMEEIQLSMEHI